MLLEGQVAVITGGGSGIGRATALQLAQEGASVVIGNRNTARGQETVRLVREQDRTCRFVRTDVQVAADVERLIDTAVQDYGRLDILFNNAGVNLKKPLSETTEAEWDTVLDSNLKGVFLGCKYALSHLVRQGSGVIINDSSNAGLIGRAEDPVYCASKHGVVGLTKALALAHGPDGVRVNAICPGPIETLMMQEQREFAPDTKAYDRAVAGATALNRIATAEEVAALVLFLCSEAGRFITGAAIPIDGGKTAGVLAKPPGVA
ncbi:MAG: short chain dehydrogenase [Dehalococcoidia bacterium]|nr:short chain dehydrogenase [Dehalococcoidia bacterium]